MSLFGRKRPAAAPERAEAQTPDEEVCTAQGRTAHKRRPGASRVRCGWPASEWVPAKPGLDPCRACKDAAEDRTAAAS